MPENETTMPPPQLRTPLFPLATVLTIPFAALCVLLLLPPSATAQYIFAAIALASRILIPFTVATALVILVSFARTRGSFRHRLFLVGYFIIVASCWFAFSRYSYGPGP